MTRELRERFAVRASEVSQASRIAGGPLPTADSTTAEVEAWLQWNDPNGCHTPKLAEAEDFEPYTDDEAWDALGEMLAGGAR